ncbi:glycosyltransferase domain-containing protein [Frigidibacter sp. MR17.14]|uniref:glycosyltransferase domain-containing protein n=1 Tax=Frigidibacter sp. MR17.14 TaxID=3126509 RepID=UPI003012AB16
MTKKTGDAIEDVFKASEQLEHVTLQRDRLLREYLNVARHLEKQDRLVEDLRGKLTDARSRPTAQLTRKHKSRLYKSLASLEGVLPEKLATRLREKAERLDPRRFAAVPENTPQRKVPAVVATLTAPPPEPPNPDAELAAAMARVSSEGFRAARAELASLAARTDLDEVEWPEIVSDLYGWERHPDPAMPRVSGPDLGQLPQRVAIYTTLFGPFEDLPPVMSHDPNLSFLCFTDQDISPAGWTVIKCEPLADDGNLSAKRYKVRPHLYLSEFDASMFVDANTVLWGRIEAFVRKWLLHEDFVMWRHPERGTIAEEAWAVVRMGKIGLEAPIAQVTAYEDEGLGFRCGLFEASFIWRRHNTPRMIAFADAWWHEITTRTKRDQLSLPYVAEKLDTLPKVLPSCLGTSRRNHYFAKLPHKPMATTRISRSSDRRITLLYDEASKAFGSTRMRVFQLADILRSQIGGSVSVEVSADPATVRDSLVIVHKRSIERLPAEQLADLRQRNDAVFLDPVDMDHRKVIEIPCDGIIACSLQAYRIYRYQREVGHVHMVTHHADPRIRPSGEHFDRPRIGYFGELANTALPEHHEGLIDVHAVDTKNVNDAWLDQLTHYNAHYAVRRRRGIDGQKPFTKAFNAARSGAVIVCDKDEGDNLHYLGEDYPYFAERGADPRSLQEVCFKLIETFGTADWRYAQEIMRNVGERSSDAWIGREVLDLLREVYGPDV